MSYKVIPVFLGSMELNKKEMLYNYPRSEKIRMAYSCFVIQGPDRTILVDTGLPSQRDIIGNNKPFRVMQDAPDFVDALKSVGVSAESVTDVIFTHLHYDHCCNLRHLPNVERIFVQKREVEHAVAPLAGEYRIYSLLPECGTPEWTQGLGKFCLVDGDAQLMPGISVMTTPGHSPGSQSVIVDTDNGRYVITGDYIPIMESFTEKIPNSIINDLQQWYDSYDKLAALGATLLPGHDICVFEQKQYG